MDGNRCDPEKGNQSMSGTPERHVCMVREPSVARSVPKNTKHGTWDLHDPCDFFFDLVVHLLAISLTSSGGSNVRNAGKSIPQ